MRQAPQIIQIGGRQVCLLAFEVAQRSAKIDRAFETWPLTGFGASIIVFHFSLPRHRYFAINLKSLSAAWPLAPDTLNDRSRLWLTWSWISAFLALSIAFSTACSCWAIWVHGRPCSIISIIVSR